jgi:hypothetical protein
VLDRLAKTTKYYLVRVQLPSKHYGSLGVIKNLGYRKLSKINACYEHEQFSLEKQQDPLKNCVSLVGILVLCICSFECDFPWPVDLHFEDIFQNSI